MEPYEFINKICLGQWVHVDLFKHRVPGPMGEPMGATLWIYEQNVPGPMCPCRFIHKRYLGPGGPMGSYGFIKKTAWAHGTM